MSDITRRGRRAFWALALGVLALAGLPSLWLVEAARDYWRFLRGWDPGVLRPTSVRRLPHRAEGDDDLELRFVEFALSAPKAKQVALAASFNGFDPRGLGLAKETDGTWRTSVPLPPGSYDYAFVVDGAWTTDPEAGEPAERAGRRVSVRRVE